MTNIKSAFQRLGTYLGEVSVEFKKISWPDRQELMDSTLVVITFIVILAVVVFLCDKVIGYVMQLIHA
jgi:preprotein translocase subunit SecE